MNSIEEKISEICSKANNIDVKELRKRLESNKKKTDTLKEFNKKLKFGREWLSDNCGKVVIRKYLNYADGHGVAIGCFPVDDTGKRWIVQVQKCSKGDMKKRKWSDKVARGLIGYGLFMQGWEFSAEKDNSIKFEKSVNAERCLDTAFYKYVYEFYLDSSNKIRTAEDLMFANFYKDKINVGRPRINKTLNEYIDMSNAVKEIVGDQLGPEFAGYFKEEYKLKEEEMLRQRASRLLKQLENHNNENECVNFEKIGTSKCYKCDPNGIGCNKEGDKIDALDGIENKEMLKTSKYKRWLHVSPYAYVKIEHNGNSTNKMACYYDIKNEINDGSVVTLLELPSCKQCNNIENCECQGISGYNESGLCNQFLSKDNIVVDKK